MKIYRTVGGGISLQTMVQLWWGWHGQFGSWAEWAPDYACMLHSRWGFGHITKPVQWRLALRTSRILGNGTYVHASDIVKVQQTGRASEDQFPRRFQSKNIQYIIW